MAWCNKCSILWGEGLRYCAWCGVLLPQDATCDLCKAKLIGGARFCGMCGHRIWDGEDQEIEEATVDES
mgnify:CR=1 FL=1